MHLSLWEYYLCGFEQFVAYLTLVLDCELGFLRGFNVLVLGGFGCFLGLGVFMFLVCV